MTADEHVRRLKSLKYLWNYAIAKSVKQDRKKDLKFSIIGSFWASTTIAGKKYLLVVIHNILEIRDRAESRGTELSNPLTKIETGYLQI